MSNRLTRRTFGGTYLSREQKSQHSTPSPFWSYFSHSNSKFGVLGLVLKLCSWSSHRSPHLLVEEFFWHLGVFAYASTMTTWSRASSSVSLLGIITKQHEYLYITYIDNHEVHWPLHPWHHNRKQCRLPPTSTKVLCWRRYPFPHTIAFPCHYCCGLFYPFALSLIPLRLAIWVLSGVVHLSTVMTSSSYTSLLSWASHSKIQRYILCASLSILCTC